MTGLLPLRLLLSTCILSAGAIGASSADVAQAERRIAALRAEIAHHDELYFREADPEISDEDYDRLRRELRDWEGRFPELAASSGLADDRDGMRPTVAHGVPMLGLEKVNTPEGLEAFVSRVEQRLGRAVTWVVEPKFDGMAVSVTFDHGRLVRAATRGNGAEGEDVTAQVRAITGLPDHLAGDDPSRFPATVELRGEVYLPYAEFSLLNADREEAGLELYAHPRTIAAGTMKQSDPRLVARRYLAVVFFGTGGWEPSTERPASQVALHRQIRDWGLPGVPEFQTARGWAEIWALVEGYGRARAGWPFPVDGLVIKVDDPAAQAELGLGPDAPRWAVAFKFPPDQTETRVTAILWQVGRTGLVTPVAEVEPIILGGTTLTRATLHNRAQVQRLDLRIGDWVVIEKAGKIVPQIAEVRSDRRAADAPPIAIPASCPECGDPLSDDGSTLRCRNVHCPAQVSRRLAHFVSDAGVGVRGLGPATVSALRSAGLVAEPADLYGLTADQLEPLVGAEVAAKLLMVLAESRDVSLERLVTALGIPRIGPAAANAVARHYGSFAAVVRSRPAERIEGLSDAAMNEWRNYFAQEPNRRQLERLLAAGFDPRQTEPAPGTALAGRTFVLTGRLPGLTRTEARALIEAAGGVVREELNRHVDFVVAGEHPGAKAENAKLLGIPVLDEAALRSLLAADR